MSLTDLFKEPGPPCHGPSAHERSQSAVPSAALKRMRWQSGGTCSEVSHLFHSCTSTNHWLSRTDVKKGSPLTGQRKCELMIGFLLDAFGTMQKNCECLVPACGFLNWDSSPGADHGANYEKKASSKTPGSTLTTIF